MKKTDCSNQYGQYMSHVLGGLFSGFLVLAAIASCIGLANNFVELVCVLSLSVASSIFCLLASQIK